MAAFPLTDLIKQGLYAGWTDQNAINNDWNANGMQKYSDYIKSGGAPLSQDPAAISIATNAQQQQAQYNYKQATDTAISGLQTGKSNLGQQYSDLLKTVKGVYDPLISQETQTAGAELSNRGLTPDSTLFQQQTQGALAPIYGQEATNTQQLGQGSISDTNAYNQAIAGLQAGVAGTASQLPLQYGALNLQTQALPSQIFGNLAQGSYNLGVNPTALQVAGLSASKPFEVQSGIVFNPSTSSFQTKGGGVSSPLTLASRIAQSTKTKAPPASSIASFVQPSL